MKKKKLIITSALCSIFLFSTLGISIGLISASENKTRLDALKEEALTALKVDKGKYVEDTIMLNNPTQAELNYLKENYGAKIRTNSINTFATAIFPEDVNLKEVYNDPNNLKIMDKVHLDYYTKVADVEESLYYPNYTSTEPNFQDQSYINYINIGDTWNKTLGKKDDGEKVKVAVIDSGIDIDHEEFIKRDNNGNIVGSVISNLSYNATEDQTVSKYGMDVIDDEQGHGSEVAGVIASQINDKGIMGIAPDIELIVIKCECDKSGAFKRTSDLVYGIYYAIEKGADVINMSFGSSDPMVFDAAIQLAYDSDIICIAATGNDGKDTDKIYPASIATVIGVGALEENSFELAEYSNYGGCLSMVAPGTAYTTDNHGSYKKATGTSIASPIVAAAAALYVAQNKYVEIDQFTEDLQASSRDLGDLGIDDKYGFGLLDVNALVVEEKGYISFDFCTVGTDLYKQRFVFNHTIQEVPEEPERPNLIFDGWYYEKAYKTRFEYENYFTTVFDEEVTLYANWMNEDDEGARAYNFVTLNDQEVEIRSYKGNRQIINIPETIEGKKVTSIGYEAFANNKRVRVVNLPNNLRIIKEKAFTKCPNLKIVNFNEGLEEIGNSSFNSCTSLFTAIIPNSVTKLGDAAFSNCSTLIDVVINEASNLESIGGGAFASTAISSFYIPRRANFDGSILQNCTRMTTVTKHPNNTNYKIDNRSIVTSTDDLTLIYVPQTLEGAFESNAEVVAKSAFSSSIFTSINLPNVKTIEEEAFINSKTPIVTFGNNSPLTYIGEKAFQESLLESIIIPKGVSAINAGTFFGANKLTTVNFESGSVCTSILYKNGVPGAFKQCSNLVEINLPDSLHSIAIGAFIECSSLESITLPDNLSSLGDSAFASCHSLKTVDFGNNTVLTTITREVFRDDVSLETVIFPQNLISIGQRAFASCYSLDDVNLPATTKTIGKEAFIDCVSLSSISYGGSSSVLESIGEEAFRRCYSLTSMNTPESLKDIGRFAYVNCALENVIIDKNVQSIGYGAFGANYTVNNVTVSSENNYYQEIDNVIYSKDQKTLVYVPSTRSGTYTVLDGTITIDPYALLACVNLTQVNLPESLDDIRFNAFQQCNKLQSISIPSNVTNIGREAFAMCNNLRSINFGENSKVSRLGIYTFAFCGIESLTIPSNVEEVGQYVFCSNPNLTRVVFESGSKLEYISSELFGGCSLLKEIIFEDGSHLQELQAYALAYIPSLETVDFGDANITTIGNYCFYGDSKLKEISIPNSVTYIGKYAFNYCRNIERFDIGTEIDYIGKNAFNTTPYEQPRVIVFFKNTSLPEYAQKEWNTGVAGYYFNAKEFVSRDNYEYILTYSNTVILTKYKVNETNIVIDKVDGMNVDELGPNLFQGIINLESVTINSNLTRIGNYCFYGIKIDELIIPNTVKEIGDYAFAGYSTIKAIISDESQLEKIGEGAFETNRGTTSISAPDSLSYIDNYAFYDSYIKTFELSNTNNLAYVGKLAFAKSDVESINFSSTLEEVDDEAFYDTPLQSVTFVNGTKNLRIGHYAFADTKLEVVNLPSNLNYIGDYIFENCTSLTDINVDSSNESYTSSDGILLNYNGARLYIYPAGKKAESYTVPNTITVINSAAFRSQIYLKHVDFESGSRVRTIGVEAFYNCINLETISLPDTIVSIDRAAFYNCEKLNSVTFAKGTNLQGIYEMAFYNCTSLESLDLPDTILEISDYAFYQAQKLRTIGIEDDNNLIFVGYLAFYKTSMESFTCSKDLIQIYYNSFFFSNLENIYCEEGNLLYKSIDGILFTKAAIDGTDYDELVLWPDLHRPFYVLGEGRTSIDNNYLSQFSNYLYKIPGIRIADSVTRIEDKTFMGNKAIRFIEMNSIDYIGNSAFESTVSLQKIYVLDHVSFIGNRAFNWQRELDAIYVKDLESWMNIEYDTYEAEFTNNFANPLLYAGNLYINNELLTELTLSDENIKPYVFQGINLEKLTLTEDVKTIGERAFYLAKIQILDYPSSVETLGKDALSYVSANKVKVYPSKIDEVIVNSINRASLETIVFKGKVGEDKIPDHALDLQMGSSITSIRNIIVEDGITEIGEYAFSSLFNTTSISLPNTLKTIKSYAFRFFRALEGTLTIPDSVETIEENAFYYLENVKTIILGKNLTNIDGSGFVIDDGLENLIINSKNLNNTTNKSFISISNDSKVKSLNITIGKDVETISSNIVYTSVLTNYIPGTINFEEGSKCTSIDTNAFMQVVIEDELILPSSLEYIGSKAINLKDESVKLKVPSLDMWLNLEGGDNLTSISKDLYINDTLLTKVVIPQNITEIKDASLAFLKSVTEIEVGNQVKTIGKLAFARLPNLNKLTILNKDVVFGNQVIYDSLIKHLKAPLSIFDTETYPATKSSLITYDIVGGGSIRSSLFNSAINLKEVTSDEPITEVGSGAFYLCSNLESVNLGPLSSIGSRAFGSCENLTSTIDLSNCTSIPEYVFDSCKKLQGVIIGENVTSIGTSAFRNTYNLTYIEYNAKNLTNLTLNNEVFNYAGTQGDGIELVIGSKVTSLPNYLFSSKNLPKITKVNCLAELTTDDIGTNALNKKYVTEASIPTSLQKMVDSEYLTKVTFTSGERLDGGFSNAKLSLTEVHLPNTLKEIGSYAFSNCNLITELIIPDSVETIERAAFYGMKGITSIRLPNKLSELAIEMFRGCSNLTEVTNIPQNITSIPSRCFYGSGLTSFIVPHSVTVIGDSAFFEMKNLTSIYILNKNVTFDASSSGEAYAITGGKVVIYGFAESTAQTFASKYSRNFILITSEIHDSLNHSGTHKDYEPATCEHPGHNYTVCDDCDFSISEETPKLSHNLVMIPSVMPTCTQEGTYTYYECQNCHQKYWDANGNQKIYDESSIIWPKVAHSYYSDYVVTKEATCSEAGSKHRYCDVCGHEEIVEIPMLEHSYSQVVENYVAPTCTEDGGYDVYLKCDNCGHETNHQHVGLGKLGHDLQYYGQKLPTCTEDGHNDHYHCVRCDKNFYDQYGINEYANPYLPATGHYYSDTGWKTIEHADCSHEGLERRYCGGGCGTYEERAIPKTDHLLNHIDAKEANCFNDGCIEHYRCAYCYSLFLDVEGKQEVSQEDITIPSHHSWGEWTHGEDATCSHQGYDYRQCSYCLDYEYKIYPQLEHTPGDWEHDYYEEVATCSHGGVEIQVIRCTVCHDKIDERRIEIDPLPHYLVHYDKQDPTCEYAGKEEHWQCMRCGDVFTDSEGKHKTTHEALEIPALGHNWGEWIIDNEATCTNDGNKHRICQNDSEHREDVIIEHYGHQMIQHTATDPTCTEAGNYTYFECNHCHGIFYDIQGDSPASIEDFIIPPSHKLDEHHYEQSSTCTTHGTKEYWRCSLCEGYFIIEDGQFVQVTLDKLTLPLKDHECNHVDEYINTCGLTSNHEYWYCYICGNKFLELGGEAVTNDQIYYVRPHTIVHIDDREATCMEQGCIEHYKCEECSHLFYDEAGTQEALYENVYTGQTEHIAGDPEIQNYTDSTCNSIGYYFEVYYCIYCHDYMSESYIEIPLKDHEFSEWYVSKEATPGESGEREHSCIHCGHVEVDYYYLDSVGYFEYFVNNINYESQETLRNSINEAIHYYKQLSDEEKLSCADSFERLKEAVRAYNQVAEETNNNVKETHSAILNILGGSVQLFGMMALALHVVKRRLFF